MWRCILCGRCGLYIVSTNVGGLPEVLPSDMISLCEPHPQLLTAALLESLSKLFDKSPMCGMRNFISFGRGFVG